MNIAILGTGKVGSVLGQKWAVAGNEVTFGSRDPNKPAGKQLLQGMPASVKVENFEFSAAKGDVILFALPWSAVEVAVSQCWESLKGKILIDATNNFGGVVVNNLEILQGVPNAVVYRAFNSLGWEVLADAEFSGSQADLFFCGPDGKPRWDIEQLITEVGLRPVWIGENELVSIVDSLGFMWVVLANRRGYGRQIAFKFLQRKE